MRRRTFLEASLKGCLVPAMVERFSAAATAAQPSNTSDWFSNVATGRSVVRASHAMVASSQPLASEVGIDVLRRGGNASDAAIAMAAVLNVTEPHMTGIGGDMFAMVYTSRTKKLEGLNASGRAPRALSVDYFRARNITEIPLAGMEPITVPGAFDGWVALLEKYGTMKLADLLAPAIDYAEQGFPIMEKTAADWEPEVGKLERSEAARSTYLVDGRAPRPGEVFKQPNLARTFRELARGGREAFYRGAIAKQAIDAPRVRYIAGRDVMMDNELTGPVIADLVSRGHRRILPPSGFRHRALMRGGQAVGIDPRTGTLSGASDHRKDGLAIGYQV